MMAPCRLPFSGTGAVGRALGQGVQRPRATGHHRHPRPGADPGPGGVGGRRRCRWPPTPTCGPSLRSTRPTGDGALAALRAVGPALDGKVVIDTSNPLDFSRVPAVAVRQQHRLAGRATAARRAAGPAGQDVQHHGQRGDGRSGSGSARSRRSSSPATTRTARPTPPRWPRDLGWTDILDLGDLTAARGLEMWMPLWLRLYGAIGRPEVQHQGRPLSPRGSAGSRLRVAHEEGADDRADADHRGHQERQADATVQRGQLGQTGLDQRRGPRRHDRDQQGGSRGAGHLLQRGQDRTAMGVEVRRQRVQRGGEARGEQAGQGHASSARAARPASRSGSSASTMLNRHMVRSARDAPPVVSAFGP